MYADGPVKKCQICGKRASISLTQIINGQISELALCEECARKNGLFDPQTLTFAEKFFPEELKAKMDKLVRDLSERMEEAAEKRPETNDILVRCPACGFNLSTFRKTGRVGCADCYTVFASELAQESGCEEAPGNETPDERLQLERELREAIEREDYEQAAILRDRLKNLTTSPQA